MKIKTIVIPARDATRESCSEIVGSSPTMTSSYKKKLPGKIPDSLYLQFYFVVATHTPVGQFVRSEASSALHLLQ